MKINSRNYYYVCASSQKFLLSDIQERKLLYMDDIIHSDVRLTWIYLRYICAPLQRGLKTSATKRKKSLWSQSHSDCRPELSYWRKLMSTESTEFNSISGILYVLCKKFKFLIKFINFFRFEKEKYKSIRLKKMCTTYLCFKNTSGSIDLSVDQWNNRGIGKIGFSCKLRLSHSLHDSIPARAV